MDAEPAFSDYLKHVKNDAIDLLEILDMALINGVGLKLLNRVLLDSDIDISESIATAIDLKDLRENKYNKHYIHVLRTWIGS